MSIRITKALINATFRRMPGFSVFNALNPGIRRNDSKAVNQGFLTLPAHSPCLLLRLFCGALFLFGAVPGWTATVIFQEGNQYQRIEPPQPDAPGDKPTVVELFWYGCRTCYSIQPDLRQWREKYRRRIVYQRLPAVSDGKMLFGARVYFTMVALGVADRLHPLLFDAIHRYRRPLDTEDALADFFAEHGVDKKAFHQAFRSNFTAGKLRRASIMSKRYGIRGAPTMIIAGRYRVDSSMVNNAREMTDVMDYLLGKVLSER